MSAKQELLREQLREKKEQLREYKAAKEVKKPYTTMKKVVFFSLLNGFAWVWCSYILAFMDKYEIAQDLSKVAITEIIGVVLVYAVKSLVENLSKNNKWPDKGGDVDASDGKVDAIPVDEMKETTDFDAPVSEAGTEDMSGE